jgi:hypothetical protein
VEKLPECIQQLAYRDFSEETLAGGVLNITAPAYPGKIVATDLQKGEAAPLLTSKLGNKNRPEGHPLRPVF